MTQREIGSLLLCLLAASMFFGSFTFTWAPWGPYVTGSLFLLSLFGVALDGRPTDPVSLSWDIGMGDELRQTGKHIPVEGEQKQDTNSMHRVAFET